MAFYFAIPVPFVPENLSEDTESDMSTSLSMPPPTTPRSNRSKNVGYDSGILFEHELERRSAVLEQYAEPHANTISPFSGYPRPAFPLTMPKPDLTIEFNKIILKCQREIIENYSFASPVSCDQRLAFPFVTLEAKLDGAEKEGVLQNSHMRR
jgi:hypothetical protein